MLYEVLMVSSGGVKHTITYFETEDEAYSFCEDNEWTWLDENQFEWHMDILETYKVHWF